MLPGFPTTLAKNTGAANPFGLYFANANTLYVADEGDGAAADAATSSNAGLQKWVLTNGTWKRAYVLQNGLNLGQQYSVANYPTTLNPSTDGLRNLTGKVNSDGTVTLYAITSTISASGDQGADPNKLVAITDNLANTDPTVGANEKFTTLRTAMAGEVLRGVAFAPTAGSTPGVNTPTIISAANYGAAAIAPGGLATANGANFATGSPVTATLPLTTSLGGSSVTIKDSTGMTFQAPLLYVSAGQVNFQVPAAVAPGAAQVTISSGSGTQSIGTVQIAGVAPGLFALNNVSLAAANAVSVAANGTQTNVNVFAAPTGGAITATPIDVSAASGQVYLILYGTGLQSAGTANVTVTIGGVPATVTYAGPQGTYAGLDQVNVLIPASLAGKGNVSVQLTANGIASNPVQITIK